MRQRVLIAFGLLAIAAMAGFAWRMMRFNGNDLGFESYTGMTLPPGIIPLAHTSRMNDNFFHTTHYWLLSAPAPLLRELAAQAQLVRSDEDARHTLTSMNVFDGPPPEFKEGYEGSGDGGRDHWLVIVFPGDRAIFEY
jgi:hypothetical protein